jgi:hypothetical protein
MSALQAEHMWQEAFPEKRRPKLYSSDKYDADGFRPLTDAQDFLTNVNSLNHLQLYAVSNNSVIALREAQDEYLELSREIAAIKGRPDNTKNPQAVLDHEVFEDRKEAVLYNYKYEPRKPALIQNLVPFARIGDELTEQEKRDVTVAPEPFSQGGFVPTDRAYKGKLNRAKSTKNIDGWKPIEKDGSFYIPVQQQHHDEYTAAYTRRALDANGEIIRPNSADSEDSQISPPQPGVVNKRLTRFGGKKHPPTRDTSEAPSLPSTPGRKRGATPAFSDREGTPKRQKPDTVLPYYVPGPMPAAIPQPPPKPRHPNQYTKAREREMAMQQAARAAAGMPYIVGPVMPDFATMSVQEKLNRKWTDEELRTSLRTDHTWLNPDPAKAAEWRDKILNGVNPVRSWSMVKKWAQWKDSGHDKRPRKKLANAAVNGGEIESSTGTPTPMGGEGGDEEQGEGEENVGVVGGPVGGSRAEDGGIGGEEDEGLGSSLERSPMPEARPTPTRRSTRNR